MPRAHGAPLDSHQRSVSNEVELDIFTFLYHADGAKSESEIARATHHSRNPVRDHLKDMNQQGRVIRTQYGWIVPKKPRVVSFTDEDALGQHIQRQRESIEEREKAKKEAAFRERFAQWRERNKTS